MAQPPSRGRFISCGGSRDGPCLANNYWPWRSGARPRVVWFSQSRLHQREEKPAHRAPPPPRVRRARGARPAAVQPASPPGLRGPPLGARSGLQVLLWSCSGSAGWVVLILPGPGPAWSPAWSTKTGGPGWSSTSPSDPQPDRGQTLAPGYHTLAMSSSQHIQEVSRRARWSHLANERSISTSKGPPPAPAKARLDAMLLLGPCLFPSPPPCSHPFSLTTNC